MLKQSVLATLLAACTLAHAAERPMYYEITATYTGFADYVTGEFDETRTTQLWAVGYDRNIDGNITVDEVQEFRFYGVNIEYYDFQRGRCGEQGGESWCLDKFAYSGGDALTFKAWRLGAYDSASTSDYAISGQYAYSSFQYTWGNGNGRLDGVRWTPDTRVTVSVNITAVPEPATYAMFGAGLCAVSAIVRRRRKQPAA